MARTLHFLNSVRWPRFTPNQVSAGSDLICSASKARPFAPVGIGTRRMRLHRWLAIPRHETIGNEERNSNVGSMQCHTIKELV